MKKETKGDFTYLQPETKEDFNYLVATNGLLFFTDKDNNLYCEDFLNNVYVVLNKEKWVVLSNQEIKDIEAKEKDDVDFDKTWQKLKENNLLPLEAINEGRNIRNNQYQEYWEETKQNKERRVIGWASIFNYPFANIREAEDDNNEHFSALIRDIADNEYLFAGDEIELMPIFDDFTTLHLSSRVMGQAVALAHGYNDSMDYALFAWAGRLYDDLYDDFERELPNEGPYEESAVVELDNDIYDYIFKYIDKFWESEYAKEGYWTSLFIVPLPTEGNYWTKNGLVIKNKDTEESFKLDESNILDIRCVRNEKELKEFIDSSFDVAIDEKEKYIFKSNYETAIKMLKQSEIIVLALRSL